MSYMGKLEFAVGLFCAVLLALPVLAEEDYYTWIDENGVVNYSERNPQGYNAQYVRREARFGYANQIPRLDYSLVDIFLTPVLWRVNHYKLKLPASAKPLMQYADRMFQRDAFEASLTEAEREMRER